MDLKIIEESTIPQNIDQMIKDGLCICFEPDVEVFSKTRAWHGSAPAWSIVIVDDDRVAAHVGIVDRVISAGGEQIRVAGIQNVFVLKNYRGQKLCDKIMDAAMKEAGRRDFDAGLLYCIPELEKVYARCGWQLLPKEDVIRVDENGDELALPDKNIAMFYPLKVKGFPVGTVHIQGNDW